MRNFLTVIILLWFGFQSIGQTMDLSSRVFSFPSNNFFRFNYENDLVAGTDSDYSQGFSFEYGSDGLSKRLSRVLSRGLFHGEVQTSVSLDHYVYTPIDLSNSNVISDDRPYAAYFQMGIRKHRQIKNRPIRLTKHTFIGLMGRPALGREIQTGIHQVTGDPIPQGWGNQIEQHLLAGYKLRAEYAFVSNRIFDFRMLGMGQLSSLKTFFSPGFELALGSVETISKGVRMNAYAQGWSHLMFYDATLQGDLFGGVSPVSYSRAEVNWVVGEVHLGVLFRTKGWQLGFDLGLKTQDYINGETHRWGAVKITKIW
jgi:hypothetical protein